MNTPGEGRMQTIEDQLARFPVKRAGAHLPAYREAGSGPALVMLHGIGSGSGSFIRQLESLADRFRIIAWDAPGYGVSPPLPMPAPVAADYAAALAGLLDALGLDRVLLAGHSLGALTAGAFAVKHPQRLAGLILMNPAGGYGAADEAVRREKLEARLALMDRLGPRGMAEKRGAALVSPAASDDARRMVVWNMSQLRPDGHAQAAQMLASGRLAEDAARYAGPALVIGSSGDTVTPEAGCRTIAAAFPRARYESIEGPGHASYLEAPDRINARIEAFAREIGWL